MSWSTTCFFLASSMWAWSLKLPLLASPCMLTGCVQKPLLCLRIARCGDSCKLQGCPIHTFWLADKFSRVTS